MSDAERFLLTDREVALLLGVCRRSLWRWASSGRMPAPVSIGKAKRWRRDELLQWIAAGCPDQSGRIGGRP